jgi:hypothetical protein
MLNKVNALLPIIFFDHALWSRSIILGLVAVLAIRRWSSWPLPRSFAITTWWFLVLTAGSITAFLVCQFFSYEKGLERLTILVVFLGTTPLLIAGFLAILIFPLPNRC